MASPFFSEGIRHDLGLEHFIHVHLALATVLFFELLHPSHHGLIHTAILGAQLVERRGADGQLAAEIRDRIAELGTLEDSHDLAVSELRLALLELPLLQGNFIPCSRGSVGRIALT